MTTLAPLEWKIPLDRTHNGIPLANGVQGLLVWGQDRIILTIGRAGFWDRRGGNPFLSKTTYQEVKALLQAGDESGLKRAFGKKTNHQDPARPHQIGGARLEIELPESWRVTGARLDLACGLIRMQISNGARHEAFHIRQTADRELTQIDLPEICRESKFKLRPSWQWTSEKLQQVGCQPPFEWSDQNEQGFIQELPEDSPLAMWVRRQGNQLLLASAVGREAEKESKTLLDADHREMWERTEKFWQCYWQDVPCIRVPDAILQEQIDFGLYMQACCTPPTGIACTLQGPLMECEDIPPWSNDYHFNINLQMIYTPALATNRSEHFQPLWQLIRKWMPDLKKSGSAFFQDRDALMLPHAVDDTCQVVGAFWTGSIDHGCTAWIGLLAYDYWRYTQDHACLKEVVWPLLKGSWAGYKAMLEQDADGIWHLPVSVSPEYKGSRLDAWGEDASFQLAALHAVLRALPRVASILGESIDPEWAATQARTPRYTSRALRSSDEYPERTRERITLWEGQDLDGSHRHHSHLAGITPFRILDPQEDQSLIENSLHWWTRRGPGGWSGWCVPWASMIHARCGQPEAAVYWLHSWQQVFTNPGRASLHDANFPGVSTLAASADRETDIMQLDGRFGALSAVLEILVQDWNDEIRILPALPQNWRNVSFKGISAPGGFFFSAWVLDGILTEVSVTSTYGNPLQLRIGKGPLQKIQLAAGKTTKIQVPAQVF